jgi:nucleoside-diphosphate-sugar epimerase
MAMPAGAWVDETRAVAPATARARRRVDAEACWRWFGRATGAAVTILRAPGIYALDREGGDPRQRVRAARRCWCAKTMSTPTTSTPTTWRGPAWRRCIAGRPQRVLNVCDDTQLLMGDYFDTVADRFGLPRPPRLTRAEAQAALSPMTLSFMRESRRLRNDRLLRELGLRCATRRSKRDYRRRELPNGGMRRQ